MGIEEVNIGAESSEDDSGIGVTGNGRVSNALFIRYKNNDGMDGAWTLPLLSRFSSTI